MSIIPHLNVLEDVVASFGVPDQTAYSTLAPGGVLQHSPTIDAVTILKYTGSNPDWGSYSASRVGPITRFRSRSRAVVIFSITPGSGMDGAWLWQTTLNLGVALLPCRYVLGVARPTHLPLDSATSAVARS